MQRRETLVVVVTESVTKCGVLLLLDDHVHTGMLEKQPLLQQPSIHLP